MSLLIFLFVAYVLCAHVRNEDYNATMVTAIYFVLLFYLPVSMQYLLVIPVFVLYLLGHLGQAFVVNRYKQQTLEL
jgi:hypothetical protein